MQGILDSSFARRGSAPIRGRKKGEFRDCTKSLAEYRISIAYQMSDYSLSRGSLYGLSDFRGYFPVHHDFGG